MTFLPVKQLGLAASSGTTPFDALFLGFSFFLIAAAVMLIALLFKLGVEQRAKELGTLGAMGLRSRKIALAAVERRAARGRDRRGGRRAAGHRLCVADHHGPADVVGRGGEHAVSDAARHAAESASSAGSWAWSFRG